jgi:hypothetical protein
MYEIVGVCSKFKYAYQQGKFALHLLSYPPILPGAIVGLQVIKVYPFEKSKTVH